jgi:Flp pilus assembly protein TadD
MAHQFKGNLEAAITDFTEATRLKPDNASAFNKRGYVHYIKGDFDSALRDFNEAVRIEPNRTSIRTNLIRLLRELGRVSDAKEQEKLAREFILNENEYEQACFEIACGNVNKALDLLKIGLEKKQVDKEWARLDPDLERIRNDPRFDEFVGE